LFCVIRSGCYRCVLPSGCYVLTLFVSAVTTPDLRSPSFPALCIFAAAPRISFLVWVRFPLFCVYWFVATRFLPVVCTLFVRSAFTCTVTVCVHTFLTFSTTRSLFSMYTFDLPRCPRCVCVDRHVPPRSTPFPDVGVLTFVVRSCVSCHLRVAFFVTFPSFCCVPPRLFTRSFSFVRTR